MLVFFFLVLLFLPFQVGRLVNADGNVACSGTGLNWYINMVGESPCSTYERLRQICNPSFQVGTMNVNTPPDACNEQVADCCCNSVAFTLSMLCLNCQQGTGSSGNGIDAGKGAYQLFLQGSRSPGSWCSPVENMTLPSNIDTAVCDSGIKIIDDIRNGLFWSDGSWFYIWSYEAISKDVSANDGNAFTHCASVMSTSTSSTTSSTVSSSVSATSSHPSGATNSPSSPSNTFSSNSPAGASTSTGGTLSGFAITFGTTVAGPSSDLNYGSSTPTSSPGAASGTTDVSNQTVSGPFHMSEGMIGGIAGAVTGAICALSVVLWFFCRSRKREDAGTMQKLANVEPFADRHPLYYITTGSTTESLTLRPRKPEFEDLRSPMTQSQFANSEIEPDSHRNDQRPESHPDVLSTQLLSPLYPLRYTDAGPVQMPIMERRMSRDLPPAYGEASYVVLRDEEDS